MRCEVCGRKILGKPIRVIIEGAKLTVCNACSKHGTIIQEESTPKPTVPKTQTKPKPLKPQSKPPSETILDTNLELAEDFHIKIRQAREGLGLSQEDLGKKLNEKVSVLRKVESGKMKPDNKLATKLEHFLKIKLLVPAKEEKVSQLGTTKQTSRELTLGDLIQMNKKVRGSQQNEGNNSSETPVV
ncbi:MAG: multiprotein bridging factor aMBF1 [Candidatus Bathyarchaeia archaeon]